MENPVQELHLPDILVDWPWQRMINPYHEEVTAESAAWIKSFNPFTLSSQHAFDKCETGRLASLVFSNAPREHLRIGCDLMNMFIVIDEYTDVEPANIVREMVDAMLDALQNPDASRPEGEVILGEIMRQFWTRTIHIATPTVQKHFKKTITGFLDSVIEQALDRDNDRSHTIESYMQSRKDNIGIRPTYAVSELGYNIPDEVFYHPIFQDLSDYVAELVILNNDLVSYNREQATDGARHNIITIAMHQFNIGVQGAINWLAEYHEKIKIKFLVGINQLPSFDTKIDVEIHGYMNSIAVWPRANDCWCFEGGRYFGSKGSEFQKTRLVPLLPKMDIDASLKTREVVVPLVEI